MEATPLGTELRNARIAAGLTLEGLSVRTADFNDGVRVPVRTIHGIEVGETANPREAALRPVCAALEPHTSLRKCALLVYGLVPA